MTRNSGVLISLHNGGTSTSATVSLLPQPQPQLLDNTTAVPSFYIISAF